MANRHWIAKYGGEWSNTSSWSTSLGGVPGASVPTENDDVFVNAGSFSAPAQIVQCTGLCKCKNISFNPTYPHTQIFGVLQVHGDATFNPNTRLANAYISFVSNGNQFLTCNAVDTLGSINIDKSIGELVLMSKLRVNDLSFINGAFWINAKDLEINKIISRTTDPIYLSMLHSTITINTEDFDFGSGLVAGLVIGSKIIMKGSGRYFNGYGGIFNDIELQDTTTIYGSNTFNDIKLPTNKTTYFEAGETQTISSLSANGAKDNSIYVRSTTPDERFILKSSSSISVGRYDIKDSMAIGVFKAINSVDSGNNIGWDISDVGNAVVYKGVEFDERYFVSGAINTQSAPAGDSLAFDVMSLKVWHDGYNPPLRGSFLTSENKTFVTVNNNDFTALHGIGLFTAGEPMTYYHDDILINKFYVQEIKQVGKQLYDVYAVSAIGLLNNAMHYGGIYDGEPIENILAELLSGIDYEVADLVKTIKIYGWLPYATKRDNLQQLTLAHSISIKMQESGVLLVAGHRAEPTGTYSSIRASINTAVDKITPATAVQVSEHSYVEDTVEIELLDETFLDEKLIIFPEPVHNLVITNGTIISSSANHALVQGEGAVTLKGKKYFHTMKRSTMGAIAGDSSDNVLFVDNATLISSLNSSKVVQKLHNAFSKEAIIKSDVIFGEERTGDIVNIINPYNSVIEKGFARKMDISFGGFQKAQIEVVKDFSPAGVITGYQNRVLLSEDQTWVVPDGVTEIRAILVGGGNGGKVGGDGVDGGRGEDLPSSCNSSSFWDDFTATYMPQLQLSNGEGGEGGKGGNGGDGGLVLDTGALNVTPAEGIVATIGAGGDAGLDGGNTVFKGYSTSTGSRIDRGYTDILTGDVVGIKGSAGFDGFQGIGNTNFDYSRNDFVYLVDGEMAIRIPGVQGRGYGYRIGDNYLYGFGGSGGGPAYTPKAYGEGELESIGGNGRAVYNNGYGFADGGVGGIGRSPQAGFNATIYGQGGGGGHGAGGGGGGGGANNFVGGSSYYRTGRGGAGGTGSLGGKGKQGCIIIYF